MNDRLIFYEKRPVDGNEAHVAGYTVLAVLLATMLFAGIFLWAGDSARRAWLALTAAGFVGSAVMFWRLLEHDKRACYEQRRYADEWPEDDEGEPEAVEVLVGSGQILRGKYKITPAGWDRLARCLRDTGWSWTRDAVRAASIVPNEEFNRRIREGVTGWTLISEDFERLHVIDGRGRLVREAREALEARLSPHPDVEEGAFAAGSAGGGSPQGLRVALEANHVG